MYKLLIITLVSLLSFNAYSQQLEHKYFEVNREVYFRFIAPKDVINNLSSVISIDNVHGDSVFAYANEKEYLNFLKYNIPCKILPPPGFDGDVNMGDNYKKISSWDSYPTYDAYVQMMTQFQTAHPDICKIIKCWNYSAGKKIAVC